jgi:hypothetical protein
MQNFLPRLALVRPRSVILVLALLMFALGSFNAQQRKTAVKPRTSSPGPATSPSPTPEPSPPQLDFQIITDRDSAGPDDQIRLSVFLANKSSKPIKTLKLNFEDPDFELNELKLAQPLPAFGSLNQTATIKPKSTAYFGAHKLLFLLEYTWDANGTEFVSSQPATATLSITHRFEEEAKGFPGGTAAFLYLLLPIIPAILSYQLFEGRRKGEEWKLPSFGADYVVPAFLVAVVVNLGVLIIFRYNTSLGYSDPLVFIAVLFISGVAGAVLPLYRWKRDADFIKEWAFTDQDTVESYLRKVLLKPGALTEFELATGRVDAEQWVGLRLRQTDGSTVLGAVLQVCYPAKATQDQWDYLTQNVINENGVVLNAERLVRMVEAKQLRLGFDTRINHAGQPLDEVVVINEVKNWKRASGQASPLVVPSR